MLISVGAAADEWESHGENRLHSCLFQPFPLKRTLCAQVQFTIATHPVPICIAAGSGFRNSTCDECQAVYRFLAMQCWRDWASVLTGLGRASEAAHFMSYYTAALASTRADPNWMEHLGMFAAADAITAAVPTPAETRALISTHFNDSVAICGLSNFNTYFVLNALATAGELDRGLATIHRCWDVGILLGGSTVWETSRPDWASYLPPHAGIPGFEDGFTSMAHPWASGATAWASAHLLGIRPSEPGYRAVVIAPHIGGNMTGVSGSAPLPPGDGGVPVAISINVAAAVAETAAGSSGSTSTSAVITVHIPVGSVCAGGQLDISELLAERLGLGHAHTSLTVETVHNAAAQWCTTTASTVSLTSLPFSKTQLPFDFTRGGAPVDPRTGTRVGVASLQLRPGCTIVRMHAAHPHSTAATGAAPAGGPFPRMAPSFSAALTAPNPFPPPSYPASLVAHDNSTRGTWIGHYGSAGYVLFAYDGAGQHLASLPSWVQSVDQTWGAASAGPWPTNGSDARALQDPRNQSAPRKIGQYSVPPPPNNGWDPSFPLSVTLKPGGVPGRQTYLISLYVVDFDTRGRKQTVSILDGDSFTEVSPSVYVAEFTRGAWLQWQIPGNMSVRFRFNYIRGDNQVVSAVAFD